MSFSADKKRQHEEQSAKALANRDYAQAFFHMGKAAAFGFNLAEQSEGKVARAYLNDANELLEMAAKLKEKAKNDPSSKADPVVENGDPAAAPRESTNGWMIQAPNLKLDDVAGLDEVKKVLRDDVINVMSHPDIYERFGVNGGGGVLMYGPPGNGKTFIAKAIAGELDAAFFAVDSSQIKDKYVGETEKNMRKLFEEATKHPRAVIFLDEVDALLQKRGNQKVNLVTQFLILADGIAKNEDCMLLLLGATNKPWNIDPAALRPGRFGKQIYVGLPDASARQAIIEYSLNQVPVEEQFEPKSAAADLEGFSGADIAELCQRAKKAAIARQIESGDEEVVTHQDFQAATGEIVHSVDSGQLAEYEAWQNRESVTGAT